MNAGLKARRRVSGSISMVKASGSESSLSASASSRAGGGEGARLGCCCGRYGRGFGFRRVGTRRGGDAAGATRAVEGKSGSGDEVRRRLRKCR